MSFQHASSKLVKKKRMVSIQGGCCDGTAVKCDGAAAKAPEDGGNAPQQPPPPAAPAAAKGEETPHQPGEKIGTTPYKPSTQYHQQWYLQ